MVRRSWSADRRTTDLGEGLAPTDRLGGPAQPAGVGRLDDPPVGSGLIGDEHVSVAVQQEEDRLSFEPIPALFEAEVHAGGNSTHRTDLQVQHDEIRFELDDGGPDFSAVASAGHRCLGTGQGRGDLVEGLIGIGRHQYPLHGRNGSARGGRSRNPRAIVMGVGTILILREVVVLELEVSEIEGCTLFRPVGELDAFTVGDFRERLGSLGGSNGLVIDLCAVPFMDSTGLGALIGGIRRVRDQGRTVEVVCDRPAVLRLFHTTGFDRIVDVRPTVAEAVSNLTAPA